MIKNPNTHKTVDVQAVKLSARSGLMSKRVLKQAKYSNPQSYTNSRKTSIMRGTVTQSTNRRDIQQLQELPQIRQRNSQHIDVVTGYKKGKFANRTSTSKYAKNHLN